MYKTKFQKTRNFARLEFNARIARRPRPETRSRHPGPQGRNANEVKPTNNATLEVLSPRGVSVSSCLFDSVSSRPDLRRMKACGASKQQQKTTNTKHRCHEKTRALFGNEKGNSGHEKQENIFPLLKTDAEDDQRTSTIRPLYLPTAKIPS